MNRRLDPTGVNFLRRSAAASLASTIPILALGAGCQTDDDDDNGDLRITAVEFDNDSTITLSFSEPVAALGEVDPNAFRLSWAMTSSVTETYEGMSAVYEYTSYRDLGFILGDLDYYYGDVDGRFSFMSVTAGASANQIVLKASASLGPTACEAFAQGVADFQQYGAQFPGLRYDFAIFLHYAGGDIPIESAAGSPLEDIGADWALSEDLYTEREAYGFVNLESQVRIPCP